MFEMMSEFFDNLLHSKNIQQVINVIGIMVTTLEKQIKINGDPKTYKEYLAEYRIPLNILILGFAFGADITSSGSKTGTIQFHRHWRPNENDIRQVNAHLSRYIEKIENPFLQRYSSQRGIGQQKSRLLTPEGVQMMIQTDPQVDTISLDDLCNSTITVPERVNLKTFKDYIFGLNGHPAIIEVLFRPAGVFALAKFGEEIYKAQTRKNWIIAGCVLGTLLVAIGLCYGYKEYKSKHNNDRDTDNNDFNNADGVMDSFDGDGVDSLDDGDVVTF